MKKMLGVLTFLSFSSWGQMIQRDLRDVSQELNKTLPEVYDHATKLMKTTVENNNLFYHFILNANQAEYDFALPKVRNQILSTICSKARERTILKNYKANIVYRYEDVKGLSLGEFMVKPEHCQK
jgi:uncharacterized membrane protein YkoI